MRLILCLEHYWHAGSGAGRGGHLDAVVRRDNLGLPLLPGRSLKGLLRDAVQRANDFGWFGDVGGDPATVLFGTPPQTLSVDETQPGLLRFSDATLPDDFRAAMAHLRVTDEARCTALANGLFREMFSTAMEEDSGVARKHSLRGIEVAVPCQLHATVEALGASSLAMPWQQIIDVARPLMRAVGAQRHRGYGRVAMAWEQVA